MGDYTCQCPGPYGTALYTMKEAVSHDFKCNICKQQIVEVKSAPAVNLVDDDDENVQIAPGVNMDDERFADAFKSNEDGDRFLVNGEWISGAEFERRHDKYKPPDVVPEKYQPPVSQPGVFQRIADSVRKTAETMFGSEEQTEPTFLYDIKLDFAHGVSYEFKRFDEYSRDLLEKWASGDGATMDCFDFSDHGYQIYYFNREYLCAMVVEQYPVAD